MIRSQVQGDLLDTLSPVPPGRGNEGSEKLGVFFN